VTQIILPPGVQPVSDNGGSLTVDAPVGTPLFARLSDGAAALVGQKTSANSLPVVQASDFVESFAASPSGTAPTRAAYVGARATTGHPTAATDGQIVAAMSDKQGRVVTAMAPIDLYGQNRLTLTTTGAAALFGAQGAGIRLALVMIAATNTSATPTRVDILDGATLIHSFFCPASSSAPPIAFPVPWIGTANTAMNVQLGTAVTDVRIVATCFRTT
jgi:hypothetical protein